MGESLYSSTFPITTPSVFSRHDASKVLVWSELQSNKTVINYKLKTQSSGWGKSSLLSDVGVENLGACLIENKEGVLLAFWSAHQNDNDDIYQSAFDGNSWAPAKRVHDKNSVPDYGVSAVLNQEREVVLRWKSFSSVLNSYQLAEKVMQTAGDTRLADAKAHTDGDISVSDKSLSDIVPPSFFAARRTAYCAYSQQFV